MESIAINSTVTNSIIPLLAISSVCAVARIPRTVPTETSFTNCSSVKTLSLLFAVPSSAPISAACSFEQIVS